MKWENGKMIKSIDHHNDKEKQLSELYKTLPRSTLIAVYRKYKFDYELFGFDFDKVLELAGYEKLSREEEAIEPWFYY